MHMATATAADLSAIDYLQKMTSALQSLNYRGTMVYNSGAKVESMQVFHKSGPSGELERLIHLSGQPREVLRKNDVVTCYMPDIRSVMVGKRSFAPSFSNQFALNSSSGVSFYTVQLNGEGRVAGKFARRLLISPKDGYRYGYRLWLDKDTSLLLKSELLDARGKTLEQVMFAEVEVVNNIPDAMLNTSINSDSFTWHRGSANNTANDSSSLRWRLVGLPQGFTLSEFGHRDLPNSDSGADHLVVSDGLATVSVYIEIFGVDSQSVIGATQFGALNVYGKILGDHKITVVGEVPELTVKMIADAVNDAEQGG